MLKMAARIAETYSAAMRGAMIFEFRANQAAIGAELFNLSADERFGRKRALFHALPQAEFGSSQLLHGIGEPVQKICANLAH